MVNFWSLRLCSLCTILFLTTACAGGIIGSQPDKKDTVDLQHHLRVLEARIASLEDHNTRLSQQLATVLNESKVAQSTTAQRAKPREKSEQHSEKSVSSSVSRPQRNKAPAQSTQVLKTTAPIKREAAVTIPSSDQPLSPQQQPPSPQSTSAEASVSPLNKDVTTSQSVTKAPAVTKATPITTASLPPEQGRPTSSLSELAFFNKPEGNGTYALHLASFRQLDKAIAYRDAIAPRLQDLATDLDLFGQEQNVSGNQLFHLRFGPIASHAEGTKICSEIQNRQMYCSVVPFNR